MKTLRTYIGVLLILVITICGIFIADRMIRGKSADLTENNLYTLSQGTENIVAKLNQPVELKLYYSRKAALNAPEQIRQYNNYFQYVRDLLREYVELSDGDLELSVIDPRPFSPEEQEAMKAGLKGIPISADESFYFGLVARTELGKQKVIPFFRLGRQKFVEYDISRLLVNVTRREKKKIGVLSSLSITGGDMSRYMRRMMKMQGKQVEQSWKIIDKLRERYKIVTIPEETGQIEKNLDFVMVVHPKGLPKKTLYALDQFVMRGGKLLAFVDPHSMADKPKGKGQNPRAAMQHDASSGLPGLLKKWGVSMKREAIAADMNIGVETRLRRNQPAQMLPVYLNLGPEVLNSQQVVTGQLGSVRMLFPGVLEKTAKDDKNITTLMATTEEGRLWKPRSPRAFRMLSPQRIRANLTGQEKKYILGALLTAPFETNFPDGPPETKKAKEEKKKNSPKQKGTKDKGKPLPEGPPLKTSKSEAAVMVYADVDMISDMLTYRQGPMGLSSEMDDNAALVMNSVEFLTGTTDLIHIRSRGRVKRPFTVFEKIRTQTAEATSQKIQQLNQKIQKYRQKLWQLKDSAGKDGLVQSATLEKRKQIQKDIREARQTIRKLNADRRKQLESLKASIQFHNLVWAPLIVLLIAIGLSVFRYFKARYYAARRRG